MTTLVSTGMALLLVSFAVGIVIGLTGMGGGALMTPALIFLGIPPSAAIANDLVAAAANKTVAAAVHLRGGTPNKRIAVPLICGSVPMALLGAWIVHEIGATGHDLERFLKAFVGTALLIAAATYTLRLYLELREAASGIVKQETGEPRVKLVPTVLLGMGGGLLVGLSSVGSGTLIMVILVLLYPTLSAKSLVGTDLIQAVPLVIAAAVGHYFATGVDLRILIPLVAGGSPGALLGAKLSNYVAQGAVRRGLVTVLSLTALSMLGASPRLIALCGVGLLTLGPVVWALVRMATGLPARPPREVAIETEGSSSQARRHVG